MEDWGAKRDRLVAYGGLYCQCEREYCPENKRAADIRAALERVEHVEGAMRADDKRLEDAAVKVFGEHRWGCDTPDVMVETILSLRQRVEEQGAVIERLRNERRELCEQRGLLRAAIRKLLAFEASCGEQDIPSEDRSFARSALAAAKGGK